MTSRLRSCINFEVFFCHNKLKLMILLMNFIYFVKKLELDGTRQRLNLEHRQQGYRNRPLTRRIPWMGNSPWFKQRVPLKGIYYLIIGQLPIFKGQVPLKDNLPLIKGQDPENGDCPGLKGNCPWVKGQLLLGWKANALCFKGKVPEKGNCLWF